MIDINKRWPAIIHQVHHEGCHVLNCTIIPAQASAGSWAVVDIDAQTARLILSAAIEISNEGCWGGGLVSHLGHQGTADAIKAQFGISILVDRTPWTGEGLGLALQLKGRPAEGAILTAEQMEAVGYSWRLIWRQDLTETIRRASAAGAAANYPDNYFAALDSIA